MAETKRHFLRAGGSSKQSGRSDEGGKTVKH
jgi:hypothetical protein